MLTWWFRMNPFFPNSTSFGIFSHSAGFGVELLSDSLWFSGAYPSWAAKRFRVRFHAEGATSAEGSPSLLYICLPVRSIFLAFFTNSGSFGVFSHSKGFGAKWHVCLLAFFAANGFRLPKGSLECSPNCSAHSSQSLPRFLRWMAVASERVLWRVPPTILYICLPHGCCFVKSSLEGSANCALRLSPSLLLGSKLHELLTCLNHWNPVPRKRPFMSLLLGYFLGFFRHHNICE